MKGLFTMEENKEQIVEAEGLEKPAKRGFFGKGKSKKPKKQSKLKAFIKRKTDPAREFMRAGIPGGMIAVSFASISGNSDSSDE